MSEENTNETVPAVLSEGEAVIPAEKLEEFQALVEATQEVTPEVEPEVEPEAPVVVEEPVAEPVENVISSGSQGKAEPAEEAVGLTSVAGGAIGTGTVKRKPVAKKAIPTTKTDTVAIFSTKNVSWQGVGKVFKGHNIVTAEQAAKWLEKDYVRVATPEDVAQEYGR
jgi:hypothetical protein